MANRYNAKSNTNKIECAWCGTVVYSNQIRITRYTKQAVCVWHTMDENYERPGPMIHKQAPVPTLQEDTLSYDSITVPNALTTLDDLVPNNARG